jgi:hypothetical protein
MTDEQSSSGRPVILHQELREDALDVLRGALRWRLEPARWAGVEAAVDALAAASRNRDVDAIGTAVHELELAGPVRARGVEDTPIDVPEGVREEINELIYTLDGRDIAKE